MVEVYQDIFVGNDNDAYSILNNSEWAILHCCKHPFHTQMVGYKGSLKPTDHNYSHKICGNRMALNLVDMDAYSPNYLDFYHNMISNAFEFLDLQKIDNKKILIHCNQGESRGPSIALLYISKLGKYNYSSFEESYQSFKNEYFLYKPKNNIYQVIKNLWCHFVVKK